MTDDFVTRLGVALRDAADREERRRAPWRALATARTAAAAPAGPARSLATLIAGLVLAAAVYGLAQLRQRRDGAGRPEGRRRAWRRPAGSTRSSPAFGSAWLADTDTQTLLRMDPATRRVTARFPLRRAHGARARQGRAVGRPHAERSEFRLLRIDPRTNRIVARLRMPDVPGGSTRQRAGGRRRQPLAAERRGGRADRPGERSRHRRRCARPTTATGRDRSRWSTATCGCRSATAACCASTAPPASARPPSTVPDGSLVGDFGMNGLFVFDQTTLSRVDPRNFHRPLAHADPVDRARGRGRRPALGRGARPPGRPRPHRRPAHRPASSTASHVGEFGAQWMAPIGSDVWMTTAGGHVVILGR